MESIFNGLGAGLGVSSKRKGIKRFCENRITELEGILEVF